MTTSLGILFGWCGAVPLRGGLVLGLFLAGLAGSPMHCAPMCGGFVLGQVADGMARIPATAMCEWRRLTAAALLPYHLGRLTTYALLGFLMGLAGATFGRVPWLDWLSGALLLLAAGLFLLQAIRRIAPTLRHRLPGLDRAPPGWERLFRRLTRGWKRDRPLPGYALGLVLGLLPCGFLYAAVVAAAASGSPLIGAAGMAAFGLGTVPALLAVGLAGRAAGRRFSRAAFIAAPVLMVFNALMLAGLALRDLV